LIYFGQIKAARKSLMFSAFELSARGGAAIGMKVV
jgi:hypothetical protein